MFKTLKLRYIEHHKQITERAKYFLVKERIENCEERPLTERINVLSRVSLRHKPKEKTLRVIGRMCKV
jgi:hypothetical protein